MESTIHTKGKNEKQPEQQWWEIVLEWLLVHHGVASNTELGILSRVCRSFQSALVPLLLQHSKTNNHLLLCGMIANLVALEAHSENHRNSDTCTSCLVWLEPTGMQYAPVRVNHKSVLCCHTWQGYTTAVQVLTRFGFASTFVEAVLEAAAVSSNNGCSGDNDDNNNKNDLSTVSRHERVAVRGATCARPESFCFCIPETRQLQQDVLPRLLLLPSSRRSVQFLNAGGSHAVCMMTPKFQCGPVRSPLTLFCVGIATEDGCFLSGIHHRFELGHLYPRDPVEEATEQSAICLCTQQTTHAISNDDDESSCDERPVSCDCAFGGVAEKLASLDDDLPKRLDRGRTGPGSWHVYTCIVDESERVLRVDGVAEPMDDSGNMGTAVLDGLTLGSDHCFGMSLCCGNGSDGEGEGAITEVAVFQGRLPIVDIEHLEREMMVRHNILPSRKWPESDLQRSATALFVVKNYKRQVPLRYLTRHRAVAWNQVNAVTGESVKVRRIGTRVGTSSSDF